MARLYPRLIWLLVLRSGVISGVLISTLRLVRHTACVADLSGSRHKLSGTPRGFTHGAFLQRHDRYILWSRIRHTVCGGSR